jgi:hypothetical protein
MNPSALIPIVRVLLLLLVTSAVPVIAEGKAKGSGREHPDMHEALDALRRAKSSAEPIKDLNTAYHRLKQGRQNKEGYRVRAMNLVEKAMEEEKAKHKIEADKLIDQAITVIEKAVTISPDRR